ncbi:hypothetical protein [Tabrizicola sp.]|uniref:hypothetical protein n=1 Tax=Tabrizicola sp. TaxID=2005166 RepID=UPI0035B11792
MLLTKHIGGTITFKLSDDDHKELDRYLEEILDYYKSGMTMKIAATHEIAEAFAMMAKGNEGFYKYIRTPIERRKLERGHTDEG